MPLRLSPPTLQTTANASTFTDNMPTYVRSSDFWGGFVLGLQENNTNTAQDCYTAFKTFAGTVTQLSSYTYSMYSSNTNAYNVQGTNIGYWTQMFSRFNDA